MAHYYFDCISLQCAGNFLALGCLANTSDIVWVVFCDERKLENSEETRAKQGENIDSTGRHQFEILPRPLLA